MEIERYRFGFVGFGHMAEILYSSLVRAKLLAPKQVLFIRRDKDKQKETSHKWGIAASSLARLIEESDVILFCVRPQQIGEVFADFPKEIDLSAKFFISLLAGIKIPFFQKILGKQAQILRVMPNLPSSIGEGMNAFSFGKNVEDRYVHLANTLFQCLGEIEIVPEEMMDAVTALSGSNPAFIASFIHAMAEFGAKEGLAYEKSLRLVLQTFIGTAKLIQSGPSPKELVEKIAVPQGTTEAGLKMIQEKRILEHLKEVLGAVLKRARELGS